MLYGVKTLQRQIQQLLGKLSPEVKTDGLRFELVARSVTCLTSNLCVCCLGPNLKYLPLRAIPSDNPWAIRSMWSCQSRASNASSSGLGDQMKGTPSRKAPQGLLSLSSIGKKSTRFSL